MIRPNNPLDDALYTTADARCRSSAASGHHVAIVRPMKTWMPFTHPFPYLCRPCHPLQSCPRTRTCLTTFSLFREQIQSHPYAPTPHHLLITLQYHAVTAPTFTLANSCPKTILTPRLTWGQTSLERQAEHSRRSVASSSEAALAMLPLETPVLQWAQAMKSWLEGQS